MLGFSLLAKMPGSAKSWIDFILAHDFKVVEGSNSGSVLFEKKNTEKHFRKYIDQVEW